MMVLNREGEPKPALTGCCMLCVVEAALRCGDHDVDDLATALGAKFDRARSECEQGVVLAAPDVDAGVEVRAALADDDLAALDDLATEALYAEVLRVGVAPVASGTRALFMCHECSAPTGYLMLVILTRVSSERWP